MPTPSWSAWPSPVGCSGWPKSSSSSSLSGSSSSLSGHSLWTAREEEARIRAALAFLAEGWALGIFPEGTHRSAGAFRGAKSGVVVLALRSGARVLPVHVGKLPGPLSRLRGRRLEIFVGEPLHLDPAMRGGAAYRAAADEVMHTIYALPQRHGRESL